MTSPCYNILVVEGKAKAPRPKHRSTMKGGEAMPIDTGYGWKIPGCDIEFATLDEALEFLADQER